MGCLIMKSNQTKGDIVILLHGIADPGVNMQFLEKVFQKSGYQTLNFRYPSLHMDIDEVSLRLNKLLNKKAVWERDGKVHFIGHSLGSLIIGAYLQNFRDNIAEEKLGRVVMLAPPHGGSEFADLLKDFKPYKWFFGPAGQELTASSRESDPIKPWYDLGIIAGTNKWLSDFEKMLLKAPFKIPFKVPDDGLVSVESTKLEGMSDHIVIPVLHGVMGWNSDVQKQTQYFLEQGKFKHEN